MTEIKEYTDEQLFTPPTSEALLEEYLEDKYIIKENATKGTEFIDSMKKRVKDNGNYCPCRTVKNNDTRCWCKDFRMQDEEGPCHCKLYVKELASAEHFKKMRSKTLSGRNVIPSKKENEILKEKDSLFTESKVEDSKVDTSEISEDQE